MLNEKGIEYRYREYTRDPLTSNEIREVLKSLDLTAKDVLRKRDRAYKELGLNGQEAEEVLIEHMAAHPTLLERPIGVLGKKAVVGRPPERLLEL